MHVRSHQANMFCLHFAASCCPDESWLSSLSSTESDCALFLKVTCLCVKTKDAATPCTPIVWELDDVGGWACWSGMSAAFLSGSPSPMGINISEAGMTCFGGFDCRSIGAQDVRVLSPRARATLVMMCGRFFH